MTKVDQFESVFRAAAKTPFVYRKVRVESVLVVTDLPEAEAEAFGAGIRSFLSVLDRGESVRWRVLHGGECPSIPELLEFVEREDPGLVCTYRHLHSDSWQWPYTLGEYVDVLTQVTDTPVLIVPHPGRGDVAALGDTDVVMAMTDHVVGDHALVNWAARFTDDGGRLVLAAVEDASAFERFMDAVGKIPWIDTASAREDILDRLSRDARDYMTACGRGLAVAGVPITVEELVATGHRLREYRRLVEENGVDLLVMHTKDEDQLAMHGLAYPLAIEVRSIPLLLL